MRTRGGTIFLLFLMGAVLAILGGCGGDLKGEGPGRDVPSLTGDFIQGFAWEQKETGHDSTVFTGHEKNLSFKVTQFSDMGTERADDYISSKLFVINSLYREIHSPYPGQLSNRIECAEEFKPVEIESSPFNHYLMYATDRFTYGACSWDLITYRTILYFLQCENENSLYQIEFFAPVSEYLPHYEESLEALGCAGRPS